MYICEVRLCCLHGALALVPVAWLHLWLPVFTEIKYILLALPASYSTSAAAS